MKLEDYKKLVEIQLLTENGLQDILEANKAYQNNEIEKEFDNAKKFKPLIQSNKELFDRIMKKTDQSDDMKKIIDALMLYNQQQQAQQQVQPQAQAQAEAQQQVQPQSQAEAQAQAEALPQAQVEDVKAQARTEGESIKISDDFVGDIIKGKNVFLYETKKGDVYTDIKLLSLNDMNKFTKKDLENYLKREEIDSLRRQLTTLHQHRPTDKKFELYLNNLKAYKEKIEEKIKEKIKDENKETSNDNNETTEVKKVNEVGKTEDKISNKEEVVGQGIKKRNGYKIKNSKYNDKIKINMDKLYNNYYVEAWYDNDIIYENQGDKDTVELLTKGRINKKRSILI